VLEVAVCAVGEFGCAVGPVEEETEGEGFEDGEERREAVVDVVVGEEAGGGEEFAVEHGEDDLGGGVSRWAVERRG